MLADRRGEVAVYRKIVPLHNVAHSPSGDQPQRQVSRVTRFVRLRYGRCCFHEGLLLAVHLDIDAFLNRANSPHYPPGTFLLSSPSFPPLVPQLFVHDPNEGLAHMRTAQVLAESFEITRSAQLAGSGGVRSHEHVLQRPQAVCSGDSVREEGTS